MSGQCLKCSFWTPVGRTGGRCSLFEVQDGSSVHISALLQPQLADARPIGIDIDVFTSERFGART